MDIFRAAYKTDCVFNRDDGRVSKIVWYEANDEAEPLPYFSAVCNLDWEIDPWQQQPVGEVFGADRPFQQGKKKIGTGTGGVCGTQTDFEKGGHYDPTLTPVVYGSNGLPACCSPVRLTRGGVGFGGRSAVNPFPPLPVRGGLGLSGLARTGRTCANAFHASIPCGFFGPHVGPTDFVWCRFDGVAPGTYRALSSVGGAQVVDVFTGPDCTALTALPVTYHVFGSCADWVMPALGTMWVRLSYPAFGGLSQFDVQSGSCPP